MIPRYEHDCSACVFLGEHDGHDLYFHRGGHHNLIRTTVIARYADRPASYASGLPMVGIISVLTEATRRAVARGLLDSEEKTGCANGWTVAQGIEKLKEGDR